VSFALIVTGAIAVTQPLSDGQVRVTTLDAYGGGHETALRLIVDDVDDQLIVKAASEVTNAGTVELVVQGQRAIDSFPNGLTLIGGRYRQTKVRPITKSPGRP